MGNKKKLPLFVALAIGMLTFSGCLKTKDCNIALRSTELEWFPYTELDELVFVSDAGDTDTISFSEWYEYADGEISEESICQATTNFYIYNTDTSGSISDFGSYTLYKSESETETETNSLIKIGDVEIYQYDIFSSDIYLSESQSLLESLDSVTINGVVYHDAYRINPADTASLDYTDLQELYLSSDFEIIRYVLRDTQETYDLVP